jgi:hypothetical protein
MLNRFRLISVLALGSLQAACAAEDHFELGETENAIDLTGLGTPPTDAPILLPADPPPRICPSEAEYPARTVQIRSASQISTLVADIQVPNTTILLGPDLVFDFSGKEGQSLLPLVVGPCVTVKSVAAFPPRIPPRRPIDPIDVAHARTFAGFNRDIPPIGDIPPIDASLDVDWTEQSARTAHSRGPLFKFGPHRTDETTGEPVANNVLFIISCPAGDDTPSDNVRLSGFRIEGPSQGQQTDDDIGIKVNRCLNVELSNLEISGFGKAAIYVDDEYIITPEVDLGQTQGNNWPGHRISGPEQVRIFGNYLHHNQHPSVDGHAAGYGVDVGTGAWAQVYENLFDFNRHAITASWDAGGYDALRNLILKGGGVHDTTFGWNTHQLDIHGRDNPWYDSDYKGGPASVRSNFFENSVQYLADTALYVRGTPRVLVNIDDNVFAHPGLENDDLFDDAVTIWDRDDLGDTIKIGPNNVKNYDTYLRSDVCDFDGDGMDDLFLATGRTWWFSSMGEFPWTYLSARHETIDKVRLGYFDTDKNCDVITESGGHWWMASAGVGAWQDLGSFGVPLNDVRFGHFDPSARDHRAGATKRTTHAFSRGPNGEWNIRGIFGDPSWHYIGGSGYALSQLNFGDFDGDGVTDVLGYKNGKWAYSSAGRTTWIPLNTALSDNPASLHVVDLNNNNIDDLVRLEVQTGYVGTVPLITFTWWVSDDGRTAWRKISTQGFPAITTDGVSARAFVGRFGVAPGGGTLVTGYDRRGYFYSEAEIARGAPPSWTTSLFSY